MQLNRVSRYRKYAGVLLPSLFNGLISILRAFVIHSGVACVVRACVRFLECDLSPHNNTHNIIICISIISHQQHHNIFLTGITVNLHRHLTARQSVCTKMKSFSMEEYCASQTPIDVASDNMPIATRTFIRRLALPLIHPGCEIAARQLQDSPEIPPMGETEDRFPDQSFGEKLVTIYWMVFPPLIALAELWMRFLANFMAPLGIIYLLKNIFATKPSTITRQRLGLAASLSVFSSFVWTTDSMLVLEFGPVPGLVMLGISTLLGLFTAYRHSLSRSVLLTIIGIIFLTIYLVYDHSSGELVFGNPVEHCAIPEGLYYDASNPMISQIVKEWPEQFRTYGSDKTPWMLTGDARTGLPFLLNLVSSPKWNRLFLPLEGGEVTALDIAHPAEGHSIDKPIYLVAHGLNGGSEEAYIEDFTTRRLQEGSTVIVMIARGLMDLPVKGWDIFHGARISDFDSAAKAIRRGMTEEQTLIGVGYSMGAIILSNYVATAGSDVALDGAMAISGGLDMRPQKYFGRAQRLWQPMLADELRQKFLLGKFGRRVYDRLSRDDFLQSSRATHITEIDEHAVAPYHGFDSLDHYYTSMSALGDLEPVDMKQGGVLDHPEGNIHSVSIPFCVLHAIDDPLITWRTVASNEGFMHPQHLTKSGKGNTMILLTSGGGHVGWPLGWVPFVHNWRWMNDAAMSFGAAVDKVKKSTSKEPEKTSTTTVADLDQETKKSEGPIRVASNFRIDTSNDTSTTREEAKTIWVEPKPPPPRRKRGQQNERKKEMPDNTGEL
jgi:predicted alpha/beta-fold hydrolase